jgi:hypothetical protein
MAIYTVVAMGKIHLQLGELNKMELTLLFSYNPYSMSTTQCHLGFLG